MSHLCVVIQACFALLLSVNLAQGHEFWIDPVDPSVAPGDPIEANIRVGEMMKGSGMIYNPNSTTFSATLTPDGAIKAEGRMGDRPALRVTTARDGLHILAHMTTASRLNYKSFDKFAKFANTHGQSFAIAAHETRGLPQEDFTEAYFRCAKALVKVGNGAGNDQEVGFPFELTALNNPYTDDGPVRLLLTYKGAPKPDHQIDIFHRASPNAEATLVSLTSNAAGEVSIPRERGDYLINAVVLEEPSASIADKLDAVWVSLWASTTYTID